MKYNLLNQIKMKNLIVLLALIAPFLFLGCSSKKVYKPSHISSKLKTIPCPNVVSITSSGATLSNDRFISHTTQGSTPKKFTFVHDVEKPIFVNNEGKIIVGDKEIELEERVITASLYDNQIAFITQSNRIGIYNLHSNSIDFQHVQARVNTLHAKIVAPLKIDDIFIFPTLNGKLLVVSDNQIVREIVITPQAEFNNPIFLGVLSNTLIASTATDIIALGINRMERMRSSVADIVIANDYLYLFTKDGKAMKLDERLQVIKEESFQFANFIQASFANDKIYALEKAGYIFEFDANLNYKAYALKNEIKGLSFLTKDALYYGGKCYIYE